jgi:hypothetical protein
MNLRGRKLLSAAVGVATVSYVVACTDDGRGTSGNLVAPPDGSFNGASGAGGYDGGPFLDPVSGNLVAPPDASSFGGAPIQPVDSGLDAGDAAVIDATADGGGDASSPVDADLVDAD